MTSTNKKSISERIHFIATVSLLVSYLLALVYVISHKTYLDKRPDFIAFYTVGRVVEKYGVEKAYDLDLQTETQEEILGYALSTEEYLIYIHPPYIIPFFIV